MPTQTQLYKICNDLTNLTITFKSYIDTIIPFIFQMFQASTDSLSGLEEDHHKAYQVLMVLEAKRAYDERLAGLFCEDWFNVDSPADIFKILVDRGDDDLPPKV